MPTTGQAPIFSTPHSQLHPERRGLLASPGLAGQPVKGTYFFPGSGGVNVGLYTTHPLDPIDLEWNTSAAARAQVMDRMVHAHINTVVMSYWSNMPQWSPMAIDPPYPPQGISPTWTKVLNAIEHCPLVVLPALEGGFDANNPQIPAWEFAREFPIDPGKFELAAGLVRRIGWLADLFKGRMNLWAQLYDRDGLARHAVNILHVSSDVINQNDAGADATFAHAFDIVAAEVYGRYKIRIGFTLDVIAGRRYSPSPRTAGAALERTASVLAIQGFASEVFSGLVKTARPCPAGTDWRAWEPAHDNNLDNLEALADWKAAATEDWVHTGVPVILDVSSGFDGRIVWASSGAGFWGDNLDYTEDRWRNWLSQIKGPGLKGIVFNTWNGYTEGYAATPSREHGRTAYNWLKDLMEPPPWDFSHMHYVNGAATHRVYGAICEKWLQLGADRGFGAPVSDELPTMLGRMQHFTDSKAIYWSGTTGAHELHGIIGRTYREEGADTSCLGLPISDEQANGAGRVAFFQHGRIDWTPGMTRGTVTCK